MYFPVNWQENINFPQQLFMQKLEINETWQGNFDKNWEIWQSWDFRILLISIFWNLWSVEFTYMYLTLFYPPPPPPPKKKKKKKKSESFSPCAVAKMKDVQFGENEILWISVHKVEFSIIAL